MIANDFSMSDRAGGSTQGVPQVSLSARHLCKSIGPAGQQHHRNGVKKQERAFERMKMASQDKI
eukprot:9965876-Ditylum_brightwellii.AAC.1